MLDRRNDRETLLRVAVCPKSDPNVDLVRFPSLAVVRTLIPKRLLPGAFLGLPPDESDRRRFCHISQTHPTSDVWHG